MSSNFVPRVIAVAKPFTDQKAGTSGLRKKVTAFQQPGYLECFVQAVLDTARAMQQFPNVLVVGGDGRFFGQQACQTIIRMALANGVRRIWIGHGGLLSTPAVSAVIRTREGGFVAQGAFVLTASHNPGGPNADFGVKYNGPNGGPAPEKFTDEVFKRSTTLEAYRTVDTPAINLDTIGTTTVTVEGTEAAVEVISSTDDYVAVIRGVFSFDKIAALVTSPDFRMCVDCMNGVGGPYAKAVLVDALGASPTSVRNGTPLEDFGGLHPDPNLTYAADLVATMGLSSSGTPLPNVSVPYDFGAALDGDADRNMILGRSFFVTPSDSLAVLVANARDIPYFASGVKSVARSMPTSRAVDIVAQALGVAMVEVPTGWKFFGNLMDSATVFKGEEYNPLICGEESFGTGSNHVREKDGLFAVLAWLSILAAARARGESISVQDIVEAHWKRFGRNVYSRYDYEEVDAAAAAKVMATVGALTPDAVPPLKGSPCVTIDSFSYTDPVDRSVSQNQGNRVLFADGSRFVFRLSGTGSVGATIRLYLEQYSSAEEVRAALANGGLPPVADTLRDLVRIALQVSRLLELTGRESPSVIT